MNCFTLSLYIYLNFFQACFLIDCSVVGEGLGRGGVQGHGGGDGGRDPLRVTSEPEMGTMGVLGNGSGMRPRTRLPYPACTTAS